MDYKAYWQQDGLQNLTAGDDDCPEGFDPVKFVWSIISKAHCYDKLTDFGCGAGRLCRVTSPESYIGIDLNPDAIAAAKAANPEYSFQEVNVKSEYPRSDICLAYTVFLHLDDDALRGTLTRLKAAGNKSIIIAEVLGQEWRRPGNPPVFNRDLGDYLEIMAEFGYLLKWADSRVYERYAYCAPDRNVRLFGLLFVC